MLPQAIIQTAEQMGNAFFGFIAHVGETESLPFNFAVAAVDHEMMFFAQLAREFRNIDATVVFDAGKSEGAEIFFGEKFKTLLANPFMN